MKKFIKTVLCFILIAALLYGAKSFIVSSMDNRFESLAENKISTTHPIQQEREKNSNTQTLAKQINSNLTDDEQKAFDTIYGALSSFQSSVYIHQDLDSQRIFDLVQLVISQHPEIFWSKGDCTLTGGSVLFFNYPYTRKETEEKNALIEQKAKEILEEINPTGTDYEKALAIFDYIVKNISYDADSVKNVKRKIDISTIEGAFINGTAVCSGYAKAYQYLLSLAGMDAITITGTAQAPTGSGSHAWTAQVIDGEIYFSDATWGDSYEDSTDNNFVNHTYFLMSSNDIEKTHECKNDYKSIKGSSDKNNYFVRESLYLKEYKFSEIRAKIKKSIENKDNGIEFRFASNAQYQKARTNLFDKEDIYFVLKSADLFSTNIDTDNLSYNIDETHNIITIFFSYK